MLKIPIVHEFRTDVASIEKSSRTNTHSYFLNKTFIQCKMSKGFLSNNVMDVLPTCGYFITFLDLLVKGY